MKICVLGAGVIGLTTAWCLAEAGHDVIIVDRHASTAKDASAANGGQLSYAFVAPLASPATLLKLPSLLLSPDSPMRIRASLDPALISWGARFLLACRPAAVRETIAAQLALAALSRSELARLTQTLHLSFGLQTAGKLVVFRSRKAFDAARRVITGEDSQQVLTPAECLALEPALRLDAGELAGGIFTASEQVGDCAAFCAGLTFRLRRQRNVEWLLNTPVVGPVRSDGRLVAIDTGNGHVQADRFVLCMGAASSAFARACGFYLPIYPLKGYSITLTPAPDTHVIRHSVTDMERKLVFAPLARDARTAIRVAGIADLESNNTFDAARVDILRRASTELLGIDVAGNIEPWCGLRPTTPDSRPIIGWSPLDGLFINSGHGMLGWTLACGSARLTADMIDRKRPATETGAFALRRAA
ncbi:MULTISPECIES: FAD-dependent oxidoreductase [unclassified Bradyrhizobium]|uniref:FAD-dependent oxidoreductase n=1 Tax=unclassified Bradyrhizobium TaxID=2631580 RepID=UPI002FF3BD4B